MLVGPLFLLTALLPVHQAHAPDGGGLDQDVVTDLGRGHDAARGDHHGAAKDAAHLGQVAAPPLARHVGQDGQPAGGKVAVGAFQPVLPVGCQVHHHVRPALEPAHDADGQVVQQAAIHQDLPLRRDEGRQDERQRAGRAHRFPGGAGAVHVQVVGGQAGRCGEGVEGQVGQVRGAEMLAHVAVEVVLIDQAVERHGVATERQVAHEDRFGPVHDLGGVQPHAERHGHGAADAGAAPHVDGDAAVLQRARDAQMGAAQRAAAAHHHAARLAQHEARHAFHVRRAVERHVVVQADRARGQPFRRAADGLREALAAQHQRHVSRFVHFGGVALQGGRAPIRAAKHADRHHRVALADCRAPEAVISLGEVDRALALALAREQMVGDRSFVVRVHARRQVGRAHEAHFRHSAAQRVHEGGRHRVRPGGHQRGAARGGALQGGRARGDPCQTQGQPGGDRDAHMRPLGHQRVELGTRQLQHRRVAPRHHVGGPLATREERDLADGLAFRDLGDRAPIDAHVEPPPHDDEQAARDLSPLDQDIAALQPPHRAVIGAGQRLARRSPRGAQAVPKTQRLGQHAPIDHVHRTRPPGH